MCETPFLHLSQLLEQDSQPYCLELPEGSGARGGQDDIVAPPLPDSFGPFSLLDPSKVSPLQLRCSDNDSFLLRHVFACEQQCLLSSTSLPLVSSRLVSCSLPVQLYSHFCSHSCDWLVSHGLSPVTFTQWCFGCSSGKRVSMFVLFCYYPD